MCARNFQMEDELDMENQLEMELAAEQEELLEVEEEEEEKEGDASLKEQDEDTSKRRESKDESGQEFYGTRRGLSKVRSLPSNFIYNPPGEKEKFTEGTSHSPSPSKPKVYILLFPSRCLRFNVGRQTQKFLSSCQQTFQIQSQATPDLSLPPA